MSMFKEGDLVWYRQVQPGGYGFVNRVPAVFVEMTPRRVAIEVLLRDGTRKRIAVAPHNVSVRSANESIVWAR